MIEFVTGSNVSSAFDASGTTLSVDVGSGSNRLLVVTIISDETNNPSVVTYNGVAMVQAVQYQHTTNDPSKVWIYYLVNPASGSNTLAVTFASGTPDAAVMAAAFTGVDQDNPLDDTSTQRDTSSPFQIVVTPSTNDQLLIVGGGDDDDAANARTPTGNTVELRDIIAGSGAGDYGGFMGYYVKSGASGNETLGYSNSGADDATLAGATFKAAITEIPENDERDAKLTGIGNVNDERDTRIRGGYTFTFVDSFDNTTYRDAGNTTASWEGDGQIDYP